MSFQRSLFSKWTKLYKPRFELCSPMSSPSFNPMAWEWQLCHHVAVNVRNINRILAVINRTYSNKSIENMMYKSLVRPILEYIHQAWYPWLIKDMQKAVRRWGTKMKNICFSFYKYMYHYWLILCNVKSNCRWLIWPSCFSLPLSVNH